MYCITRLFCCDIYIYIWRGFGNFTKVESSIGIRNVKNLIKCGGFYH